MKPAKRVRLDLSTRSARALQVRLSQQVETEDRFGPISRVAGLDVGIDSARALARAAVVVLSFPGLEVLEQQLIEQPVRFPYVPGLLSFREIPPLLKALSRLRLEPDLIMCDGHGIAHPRRFGLACHLGVLLDVPSIGVAKSRLVGQHEEPGQEKGQWRALTLDGETVAAVLRTRARVRPVYVSTGHRVGLASAIELCLACTAGFRLPEATRLADKLTRGVIPRSSAYPPTSSVR